MEQKLENKLSFQDKVSNLLKNNKLSLIGISTLILIILIIFIFVSNNQKKKNLLLSEKFTRAGVLLSLGKNKEAKKYYEEIVLSENNFYSLLALNVITEKNLITNKQKIKDYFEIVERLNLTETNKDLIQLKKGLYFIKISDAEIGNEILKRLIQKDSNLKKIAEEIIKK